MSVAEAIQTELAPPASPGLHLVESAVEAPENPRGFLLGSKAVHAFYDAIYERGEKTPRHLYKGLFVGPGEYPMHREEGVKGTGAFAVIYNAPENHNFRVNRPSILGIFANHPLGESETFTAQIPFWNVSIWGIKTARPLPAQPVRRWVATYKDVEAGVSAVYDSAYTGPIPQDQTALDMALTKASQIFEIDITA